MTVYRDIPVLGGSPSWENSVADYASLPTVGQSVGEMRVTLDTMQAYMWDGDSWELTYVPNTVVGPASSDDGQIMLYSGASGKLSRAATGDHFVRVTGGVYGTQEFIGLSGDVSGVLPIANGGTNSGTPLHNARVMMSSGGAIVECSAISPARVIISNPSGLPVASPVTSDELAYVGGVTSGIQGQFTDVATALDGKEPTIAAGAATDYWAGDKSWQNLEVSALQAKTDGSSAAAGAIGELITSTVAANTTTGVGASGDYGSVTSVELTAGVWALTGTAGFSENGADLTIGLQVGVSDSATGSGMSEFDTQMITPMLAGGDPLLASPVVLVNIAATTTYHLNTRLWYTAGSPMHRGRLQARRIR